MRWSITTARAAAIAPSMSDDRTAVAEKCAGHPTWTDGSDAPDDAAADAATPPIAMAAHKSPVRTPGSYPRRRDSRTRQTRGRFKTGRGPDNRTAREGGSARAPPPLHASLLFGGSRVRLRRRSEGLAARSACEREPRNRRLEADRRLAPVTDAVRERLLQARPLRRGERHRVVGRIERPQLACHRVVDERLTCPEPRVAEVRERCRTRRGIGRRGPRRADEALVGRRRRLVVEHLLRERNVPCVRLDRREPAVHREEGLQRDRSR